MRPPTVLAFYPQYPDLRSFSLEISYTQQVAPFVISMPDTATFPVTIIAFQPKYIQGLDEIDIQLDHVDGILQKSPRKDIAMMKIYRYHGYAVNVCREEELGRQTSCFLSYFIPDGPSFPC